MIKNNRKQLGSLLTIIFLGVLIVGSIVTLFEAIFRPEKFEEKFSKNFIVRHIIGQRFSVSVRANVKRLNLWMPKSFKSLAENIENEGHPIGLTPAYFEYYRRAAEYMPHMAETHALLGFCYFHQGEYNKAIGAYKEAVSRNPHFFWFHYNLGVLYYKIHDFQNAIQSFQTALKTDPNLTVTAVNTSKVYHQILAAKQDINYEVSHALQKSYENAYQWIFLCQLQWKDYHQKKKNGEAFRLKNLRNMVVRIF